MIRIWIVAFGVLLTVRLLAEPCEFDVSLAKVDVRCHGDSTGQATVTILQTGADTGPYVIEWFDGDDRAFRDDLPAGTHFVKVTDALGCFVNEFVTIDQPGLLNITLNPTNVACHGDATGSIDLVRTGGVSPFDFQWSNGESTEDVSVLVAGSYSVTVTDGNGCQTTDTVTITEPEPLGISPTVVPVSCFGGADGQIKTEVFGGTAPYRYLWSTTGDTIRNILNLKSQYHSLQVTDANNCTLNQQVYVPQPDSVKVQFAVTDLSCYESGDGEVSATVIGGTPTYTYEWSNSSYVLGDTTAHPQNLISDYFTLTVTDSRGCNYKDSVFVDQPPAMVLNLRQTPASCFKKPDGAIALSISGGSRPYQILWSNDSQNSNQYNLLSGQYEVVVTDAEGCTQYGQIMVEQPDSLDFGFSIAEVSCKDQDDGSISLNPTGGTPEYSVFWSTGSTDLTISDLPGGDYSVILTDANTCKYPAVFTVGVNPQACITRISIPNTFTPNNDGYNDEWVIKSYEVYPRINVQVYNKWGKRIFQSVGYQTPWDGTYHGKPVEAGTYFYVVDLENGDPSFSGVLTIVR